MLKFPSGTSNTSPPKCFSCGKIGHLKKIANQPHLDVLILPMVLRRNPIFAISIIIA